MKSEDEIKSMVRAVLKQRDEMIKGTQSYQMLNARISALCWVLETERAPGDLCLSQKQLDFLSCFW